MIKEGNGESLREEQCQAEVNFAKLNSRVEAKVHLLNRNGKGVEPA
jgi:hypothetical protein